MELVLTIIGVLFVVGVLKAVVRHFAMKAYRERVVTDVRWDELQARVEEIAKELKMLQAEPVNETNDKYLKSLMNERKDIMNEMLSGL